MDEPLIDRLQEVWADIVAVCDDLTDEQWQRATDCPGWSVQDHVAHMIGTEMMLLGEDPPLADDRARAPRPQRHRQVQRAVDGALPQPQTARTRSTTSGVSPAGASMRYAMLPAAKWDEEGFTPEGPGPYRQFMAIRVFDCWYHDQDIREATRPARVPRRRRRRPLARPHPDEGAAVRRREEGAARRRARRSCSTSPASRRSKRRSASTAAPRSSRRRRRIRPLGSPSTAARSPGSPAVAGPARRPAPRVTCRSRATRALGARVVDNLAFTL